MLLAITNTSLIITALTGISHACSGIIGKKASTYASPLAVMTAFLVPCTLVGMIWLIIEPNFNISVSYWAPFSVTLTANIIANICFFRALKTSQVSLVGSTLGLVPLFSAVVARLYLGEMLTPQQWIGICLSFIGLAVMYIPKKESEGDSPNIFAFFSTKEGWLMMLATLGWAIASPFDKEASRIASPQMHNFLIYALMIPPSIIMLSLQGELRELCFSREQLLIIFTSGLMRGLAFALQLIALLVTPVGVFEMTKRITLQAVSIVGGKVFFKEDITIFKIIGTLIFMVAIPLAILK